MNPTKQRIEYLDTLRVLATVAVVGIHVCSQKWHAAGVESAQWQILNLYHSLVNWAVPVFFMISGVLFLDGQRSCRSLFTKYLPRIVTAFLFWSGLYAAIGYFTDHHSLKTAVEAFFAGDSHLWFLYTIAGLYLATPLLRKIVESRKLTRYFLAMALIFACVAQQLMGCAYLISDTAGALISGMVGDIRFGMVSGYVLFFVGGYYLHNTHIPPKWRKIIYALGIAGVLATVLLSSGISLWRGLPVSLFHARNSVTTVCVAAAVFVFAKYHVRTGIPWIRKLSKYSFGGYLVHILVLELITGVLGVHALSFHPLISVPVISVAIFAVSFAISAILNHIPILRKYIV